MGGGLVHRMITRRRRDGEDGLAIVLVALSMAVLMVFGAFAIDLGAAWGERRKGQTTADAGALSGGRLLLEGKKSALPPTDIAVANEVIELTYKNLLSDAAFTDANDLTLPQWRQRWNTCTDSARSTTFFPVVSLVTPCISYNSAMTRVRVRVPDLNVPTSLARVIGINKVTVYGEAEAELIPDGGGGLLPFGLLQGAGGPEVCLRSGSQPELPPCNGPDTGNFGSLDIAFYGNPVIGTHTQCTGQEQLTLGVNIAQGVDHPLDEYRETGEETESIRDDRALCPDLAAFPNQVRGRPGIGSNLDEGLVEGENLNGHRITGRLTRGPYATFLARSGSPRLDDRPLWQFIDPNLTTPAACVRSTITSKAQMAACLADPAAQTTPLFTADDDNDGVLDILRSPRLAWVPEFHQTAWAGGASDPYQIKSFRAVFLQTMYFRCSASPSADCGVFEPGEPTANQNLPVQRNRTVEAITALLLPDGTLPTEVHAQGPRGPREYTLVLRR